MNLTDWSVEANKDKGISLVIFFLVTLVPGMTTVLLFSRCQRRMTSTTSKNMLALLKCFAGGVFLSTCLLGLVNEGLEEYEEFKTVAGFDKVYPFFHLGIGIGFFLVAYMERIAVSVSHSHAEKKKRNPTTENVRLDSLKNFSTAVVDEKDIEESTGERSTLSNDYVFSPRETDPGQLANVSHKAVPRHDSMDSSVSGEGLSGSSGIRAVIVLLALSFHTLFDGLAVGLQDTVSDIWGMTVAITIHKTIMIISLALELAMSLPERPFKIILLLFLFALMTPVGVAIGMGVTSGHVNIRAQLLTGSILQAVASGSILYVTFFEILSEELGHHSSVTKISVTVFGFGAIAVAKIWDSD